MSKMDDFASNFRQRYLAVSGGWLGSVVVGVAKPTGAWDPMVAAIIAVVFYQIVRTSKMEIAIMMGITLDGVIPYQYWQKESSYELHKDHLDDYWPIFLIGTLIELGAYVLADSSIFTMVVCVKSIALSFIWMGQTKEGVFLSSSIRHGKLAKPTTIPLGGVDWVIDGQDIPSICDKRLPTAYDDLSGKYSELTAWGMVSKLKTMKDEDAKKTLERWMKVAATKEKQAEYAKRAREVIRTVPTKAPPPISPDPRYPNADRDLTSKYPDPWTRWGMIYMVKQQTDDKKAGDMMESLLKGPAKQERKDKYANIAKEKVGQKANANPTQSSTTNPTTHAVTRVSMDLGRANALLIQAYPTDPIVREGMIETYRADQSEAHAEAKLQSWTDQTKLAQWKTEYLIKGQRARQWRKELRNQRVPVFVDDDSDKWNQLLKPVYPQPWVRHAIIARIWTYSSKQRETKITDKLNKRTEIASSATVYSEQGEAIRDLFDDEGWERKILVGHEEKPWMGEELVTGADRGGGSIGNDRLASLGKEMRSKNMGPSEVAKILEIFSRSRCETQEAAAVLRLRFHGIKDFKLSDTEKAKNVKRFMPTINPTMAATLAAQLDDPEVSLNTRMNRQLAAELLRAKSHSREDMRKVADVLGEFGINPSAEAKATLDLDPATLLDLRLKLISLYDKGELGTSLVDVMMSHVIRSSSLEIATREANLMIEEGNQDRQNSDHFLANAQRLENMKTELLKVFKKKSIVEAMKVDILGKPPSEWDQEYARLWRIGSAPQQALYQKTVDEYKDKAVDDEYYKQFARNDLNKPGLVNAWLSKVGVKRVYFGK